MTCDQCQNNKEGYYELSCRDCSEYSECVNFVEKDLQRRYIMGKFLEIKNENLIEKNAFHLIGACTKRGNSSAIGFFGSGLKYAIAVLLREKINFRVFCGNDEIEITTKQEIFRDKKFDVIYIDGEKTSLTTDMGPKWKTWQSIREILCNAIDESNYSNMIVEDVHPTEESTSFYIDCENEQMQKIISGWDKYFSFDRVSVSSCVYGDIFNSLDEYVNIYRKGIRCYDENQKSCYDYNLSDIEINESRIIESTARMKTIISNIWKTCATESMLNKLCDRSVGSETLEYHTIWYWCDDYSVKFGEQWYKYFKDKVLIPRENSGWFINEINKLNSVVLSKELIRRLKRQFPDIKTSMDNYNEKYKYKAVDMTDAEKFRIKKVLQFFEEVKIRFEYPIQVGVFEEKSVFGRAHDGKVIVSRNAFDHGTRAIALTVLEEVAHLESQKADETREFQNYLLNQILTLLENQNGIFL